MNALLVTNGIIYLGGFFTHVGPYTGGFTLLDKTTGQNDGTLPRVHGRVRAIASDGAGGWYIGGEFTKVADVAVTNLVHIRKDKTVDRVWKPNPDGAIRALKLSGNVVFVAGSFTSGAAAPIPGVPTANGYAPVFAAPGLPPPLWDELRK